jgi:RNA polymerase sigma-70 factor (sigma-E family)
MDAAADAEFSEFMQGRWTKLVRLGYVLTGDRGLAEDLAQTALARAYASWPRVRRAADPDAYVRRVMVNANSSRFRRRRVREELTGVLPEPGGPAAAQYSGERAVLLSALMSLPYGQRAVVVLRYWIGMTESEVAATLGCSVGNVKSQSSRALAKLRAHMELSDEVCHEHG